mmetsp:Transcript_24837/g.73770  ORF Transcript_24837/g.73770 Transcript_24837/m.73770 type:complete len:289 (+) Transcript_24837:333-1199(+)
MAQTAANGRIVRAVCSDVRAQSVAVQGRGGERRPHDACEVAVPHHVRVVRIAQRLVGARSDRDAIQPIRFAGPAGAHNSPRQVSLRLHSRRRDLCAAQRICALLDHRRKACAVRTDGNLDRVDRLECVDVACRIGAVEIAFDRSAVGAKHACAGGAWSTPCCEVHVGSSPRRGSGRVHSENVAAPVARRGATGECPGEVGLLVLAPMRRGREAVHVGLEEVHLTGDVVVALLLARGLRAHLPRLLVSRPPCASLCVGVRLEASVPIAGCGRHALSAIPRQVDQVEGPH